MDSSSCSHLGALGRTRNGARHRGPVGAPPQPAEARKQTGLCCVLKANAQRLREVEPRGQGHTARRRELRLGSAAAAHSHTARGTGGLSAGGDRSADKPPPRH